MDSKRFKRKKFAPSHVNLKFPQLLNDKPYIGIYNGHNVTVVEKHAIHDIYMEGNYGKGSLSKSAPTHDIADDIPEIILQQQWHNRLKWENKSDDSKTDINRICIDSVQNLLDCAYTKCDDNSWKNWKKRIKEDGEVCDKKQAKGNFASCNISNEMRSDDPLHDMVESILQTRKIKEIQDHRGNTKMVLVVEDSSIMEDFNLSNIKVKLKKSLQNVKETLKLSLVEAFFLCFATGRLKIVNEYGVIMSIGNLWEEFSKAEDNFVSKYVTYHHYRSHGWTVRSGIKFGGDYLLYKIGPAYYHASYLVWLLDKRQKNQMSWSEFIGLNRLVETCNKDLLLCEIVDSNESDRDLRGPNSLSQFTVLEVVCKRWIPSQERTIDV